MIQKEFLIDNSEMTSFNASFQIHQIIQNLHSNFFNDFDVKRNFIKLDSNIKQIKDNYI